MMNREDLRLKSMENRTKNYSKNRTSVEGYVEKEIMSAVAMGRTSTVIDSQRLKMIAFGNSDLMNDVINYYRGKDLTISSVVGSDGNKKITISWD